LLGVAAGLFFLLAWNRLHDFGGPSPLRKAPHQALGLFGAGVYLFSATPILFEMRIGAEGLCMFAQMLSLWLFVQFLFYRFIAFDSARTVSFGIAALAAAWLLYSLKPSYTLTALGTMALVVAVTARARLSRKQQAAFFAGALGVVLLFVLPERVLAQGDRLSRMFLPQTLFAIHANIIRAQMGDDLEQAAQTPVPRTWLQTAYNELGTEINRTHERFPGQFSLLGFQPDYLMNGGDAIMTRWLHQLGGDDGLQRFLQYYFWRAVRHRPLSFAKKIALQLGVFYNRNCPAFLTYPRILLGPWHYGRSLSVLKDAENWEQIGRIPAGIQLASQTEALATQARELKSGRLMVLWHALLERAYLPLLLVSATVAGWVLLSRRFSGAARTPAFIVFFLFLANFGNVLAISTVHSMEVDRYSTVQFAAALFAELWAIRYLVGLGLRRYQLGKALSRRG
jgi:hypothetical protein